MEYVVGAPSKKVLKLGGYCPLLEMKASPGQPAGYRKAFKHPRRAWPLSAPEFAGLPLFVEQRQSMSYLSQLDLCFDFPQLVLGFWKKHTSFPFHSVSYDIESVDKLGLRAIDMFSSYLPELREHLLLF